MHPLHPLATPMCMTHVSLYTKAKMRGFRIRGRSEMCGRGGQKFKVRENVMFLVLVTRVTVNAV